MGVRATALHGSDKITSRQYDGPAWAACTGSWKARITFRLRQLNELIDIKSIQETLH